MMQIGLEIQVNVIKIYVRGILVIYLAVYDKHYYYRDFASWHMAQHSKTEWSDVITARIASSTW